MTTPLVPISISSQIDAAGDERIHAAKYTSNTRLSWVCRVPSITGNLPDGSVGDIVNYQYNLIQTESGQPVTAGVSSGALSPGLMMSASGLVSGTLTTSGTFSWMITPTSICGNGAALADNEIVASLPLFTFNSTWKYKTEVLPTDPDYSATAYDDSAWLSGPGGFGNSTSAAACYQTLGTASPSGVGNIIWLRRHYSLPTTAGNGYGVYVYADDSAKLYWNGVLQTLTRVNDYTFHASIPDASITGADVSALRVIDGYDNNGVPIGSANIYASMEVYRQILETNGTAALLPLDSATLADTTGRVWAATANAAYSASGGITGGGCWSFTGGSIMTRANADPILGLGDYTVECFVNIAALANWNSIFALGAWNQANGLGVIIGATTANFIIDASSATAAAHGMVAGNWYHVAFSRQGTTSRLFIGGALIITKTATGIASLLSPLRFGGANATSFGLSGINPLSGKMQAIRVTRGTARYTAAFTPPAPPLTL